MPLVSQILFEKHDKDHSGAIDASELKSLAYSLGHPLDESALDAALHTIDSSGDGRITYDEFRRWWAQEDRLAVFAVKDDVSEKDAAEMSEWMKRTTDHFAYFDTDKNGTISREEFSALYANLVANNYVLPGSEVAARSILDANGDGIISLMEYVAWLRKSA